MEKEFFTLDDFDFSGKTVICRVDINSPIDEENGRFINTRRLEANYKTLKELEEKGAKTVILAHQGRPGTYDFTPLEQHSKYLKKMGLKTEYVDGIFCSTILEKIKKIKPGTSLLLENVRFYSEESIERPYDVQARTFLVERLAPVADYYVTDCFAVSHRSHPSIVGFYEKLPIIAGRVTEEEITSLDRVLSGKERPSFFLLGGIKIETNLRIIKQALRQEADKILVYGVIGNLFLWAKGYDLGIKSIEFLKGVDGDTLLPEAKKILSEYEDRIETPVDVAIDDPRGREEFHVSELPKPNLIADIGRETVGRFLKILEEAKTLVVTGPPGIFEKPPFDYGTKRMLSGIAGLKAFKVAGGGHTSSAIAQYDLKDKFDRISTGGNACLYYLAGKKLPGIDVLKQSYKKNKGKKR